MICIWALAQPRRATASRRLLESTPFNYYDEPNPIPPTISRESAARRRHLLMSATPTQMPSPVPIPAPTASPVPTTSDITTFNQ